MKAAIWGAGNIAATHADALKSAGIEIVAVVDRDAERAAVFAAEWGIKNYGDDPSIILAPGIDAVHVCTPPNLHFEMVMKLLEHNKHVLCEKPLCFEDSQAEELARIAKEKGLVCAINLNVRYHVACQKARDTVQSGDFGPVLLIHGNYLQEFSAMPVPMGWRFNTELAGRMHAVTEIGTHWMDIVQFISGRKIQAVSALFGKPYPDRVLKDGMMYPPQSGVQGEAVKAEAEDMAAIMMRFDNGAIGSVVLSEMTQGRINHIQLEITGEKKNLWWNAEQNNLLHTAQKGGGTNTETFAFGNGFMDTFRSLISEFYSAVKEGAPSATPTYPDFEQGKLIVKICNAILQSADNNSAWVSID